MNIPSQRVRATMGLEVTLRPCSQDFYCDVKDLKVTALDVREVTRN